MAKERQLGARAGEARKEAMTREGGGGGEKEREKEQMLK